jgi:hypothetical protein
MALSVMSAFARRNVDPWREAARLSQLPRDIATRELCAMIAEFPHGSPSRASPQAIAERLMAPLPRYASSAASPRKTPPGRVALSRRETVRSPVVLLFSWSRRRSWRSACNRRLSIPSCQRRSLRPCGGSSWARGFWRGVRIALSFGRCARNLIGGRGRVRRRLQLGARVLRDVGEIGRQSWRPNGQRFGLGSIVVWFGHGVSPSST